MTQYNLCTVSSNFLLDKGRVAENLQKEYLCYFVNCPQFLKLFANDNMGIYKLKGCSPLEQSPNENDAIYPLSCPYHGRFFLVSVTTTVHSLCR